MQATVGAVTHDDPFAWHPYLGHNLIEEVSIEIGGQTIDKHYGTWLNIWNDLTQTSEKEDGYKKMVGNTVGMTSNSADPLPGDNNTDGTPEYTMYVPLQFWFCRNPGLALPLIALQYHEVKFNITFANFNENLYVKGASLTAISAPNLEASLYVDYIYLDTDERRQFAQVQHEYLIEQLQFTGAETVTAGAYKSKLALNHPCKELIWVVQEAGNTAAPTSYKTVTSAKLQLNGQDRFSERDGAYFNLVQPYQHHTSIPSDGVYVYSFALNPEQHQPSGTVNMSRIDNATLQLTVGAGGSLKVFAVNYNVLRIMAGIKECIYINLCQTVSCIISFAITYYEKQCKLARNQYMMISI